LIMPTSVQFSRGPRKYDTPLFKSSVSILRSEQDEMALQHKVAAIVNMAFGRVDLNPLIGQRLKEKQGCCKVPKYAVFYTFAAFVEQCLKPTVISSH